MDRQEAAKKRRSRKWTFNNNMATMTKRKKKFTKQTKSDSWKGDYDNKRQFFQKTQISRLAHTGSSNDKYLGPQWKLYDLDDLRHTGSGLLAKEIVTRQHEKLEPKHK